MNEIELLLRGGLIKTHLNEKVMPTHHRLTDLISLHFYGSIPASNEHQTKICKIQSELSSSIKRDTLNWEPQKPGATKLVYRKSGSLDPETR